MKDFFEEVAAFRSAFALMQVPKLQSDYKDVQDYDVLNGEITFKNVTFHFENSKNMFLNLNLHIPAGQKVGLVGYSGAGKSTLIALLLKNFQINEGDIFIDNQNLNCWNSDSLRAQIALIPQDIMLFHRTIVENIGYGNKLATQHQIEQAAKAANIHDDIVNLPEGYNTLVGERGIKLSGGQRQRIAIARAILKNTKILILDEATSSLDSKTEYEIQQSITTLLSDTHATVIAIAHRLSTIKDMDRILVMDKGQIVEDGSFQQLILKENGFFKKLWEHQTDITASV
jgi:ATP-binding cassette subfamily B protein